MTNLSQNNSRIRIHQQIEADLWNLQEMVNRLPLSESKGEYRSIAAGIKIIVKEIHNQRVEIEDKMFERQDKVQVPLFEVEPSPVSSLEQYQDLSSFFGKIDEDLILN